MLALFQNTESRMGKNVRIFWIQNQNPSVGSIQIDAAVYAVVVTFFMRYDQINYFKKKQKTICLWEAICYSYFLACTIVAPFLRNICMIFATPTAIKALWE